MAGMNKVAANVDEALSRVHGTATPMNCKRLGKNTPLFRYRRLFRLPVPRLHLQPGRYHKTKRHRGTHQSHSDRRGTWILKSRFPPDKAEKIPALPDFHAAHGCLRPEFYYEKSYRETVTLLHTLVVLSFFLLLQISSCVLRLASRSVLSYESPAEYLPLRSFF